MGLCNILIQQGEPERKEDENKPDKPECRIESG
jgi:hypothetical protein